ncbi:SpaA isopeptide-forming pilin-related protein [Clostridium cibarium]|uniref:Prealbumin-like fold domain-containing protein n=1 Tax=Clostridium cibarium TaxID=2762247 RepID=A0ABR8PX99_9CLOT|nr:prealbumin-like fold domain-containing protein [Clostridium cibarium]
MKDEKSKNIYFTNMQENDPLMEKFMNEYIDKMGEKGKIPTADDLIVNFDITYADGTNKNYTCGSESCVFGDVDDCDEKKEYEDHNMEEEGIRYNSEKSENYNKDFPHQSLLEFEEDKWDNCRDEWREYIKKCKCYYDKEDKREIIEKMGKVTVYSILKGEENTKLKGVKVNLYRINGLSPVLVESQETDSEGRVVFSNIEDGSYRIIEFIDRTYFEKPSYVKWNEVTIDKCNKESTIYAMNSIRQCPKY